MQGDSPRMDKNDQPEDFVLPRTLKRVREKTRFIRASNTDCGDESIENEPNNQLVLYDSGANNTSQELIPLPDERPFQSYLSSNPSNKVLPSVGAFTVQCSICFKWRLIPTKEKYEEIREHILECPFECVQARSWRSDISCDDPADITQDGSRLWAIDKPNIAQTPPGWERLLRIRGEGSTRFADVYYVSPSGKRMRSMVEVQKYLLENPKYAEQGITINKFSFLIPRPLQENYVRKRVQPVSAPYDGPDLGMPPNFEPDEVNPLAWEAPSPEEFDISRSGMPPENHEDRDHHHQHPEPTEESPPPAKKRSSKPKIYIKNSGSSAYNQHEPQAKNVYPYNEF